MADIAVVVTPRASQDRIGPMVDGALRIGVTRPASDGEANRAVLRLLARALGVASSQLSIVSGERGRTKRISVAGLDGAELAERLRTIGSN